MLRRIPFAALGAGFLAAFLFAPVTVWLSALLGDLNEAHRAIIQEHRQRPHTSIAATLPVIEVPVRPAEPGQGISRSHGALQLRPDELVVEMVVGEEVERIGGFRVRTLTGDVAIRARFAEPDWTAYLEPGEIAVLSSMALKFGPFHSDFFLGNPRFTLDGAPLTIPSRDFHGREAYSLPLEEVPGGEVGLTYSQQGGLGHVRATPAAARGEVRIVAEPYLAWFSGPRPDAYRPGLRTSTRTWRIDGYAEGAPLIRVGDTRPKPQEKGTFLGMRLVGPDEGGPISYDAAARSAAWNAVDRLIRFVPALTALMALGVVALGLRDMRAQAELALAVAMALAAVLWLSPRIGYEFAWFAGAGAGGAALAVLLARARVRALIAGLGLSLLWLGVWRQRDWVYPDPERTYMILGLSILAVGGLALIFLGLAALLRPRRGPVAA